MWLFKNRIQAAQQLSENLGYLRDRQPVILALANGGVPIGDVIARNLNAPLDVLLIEKLFVPQYPNQCVGAVDEHGRISVIHGSTRWHNLGQKDLAETARKAFPEIQRRHNAIRSILPELDVRGRAAIIVDEGVDSGARMVAAIASVRGRGATRITVAAPAGATEGTWQLHALASEVVIPHHPTKFKGVEHFYEEFREVSDAMVLATLEGWVRDHQPQDHGGVKTVVLKLVGSRRQTLMAEVDLPANMARGERYPAVIFVHGFESSARSPRAMAVSERLSQRGIVSVRLDFTGHGRSDGSIEDATDTQMRDDLRVVVGAVRRLKEVDRDRLGIVGGGAGAMIALQHVAEDPAFRALVLRGPVCEMDSVHAETVRIPTLLIHAEGDAALDESVQALDQSLAGAHKLMRIANADRMFNDAASLARMAETSVDWLTERLLTHASANAEPVASEAIPAAQPQAAPA